MKKSRTILTLLLALALSLCACNGEAPVGDSRPSPSSTLQPPPASSKLEQPPVVAPTCEDAIVNALDASLGDAEALMNCLPEVYVNGYLCAGSVPRKVVEARIAAFAQKAKDSNVEEFGKDFQGSYELMEKNPLSQEEISAIEKSIADTYGVRLSVTQAYALDITLRIAGAKDRDSVNPDLTAIQVDSQWYIVICTRHAGKYQVSFLY